MKVKMKLKLKNTIPDNVTHGDKPLSGNELKEIVETSFLTTGMVCQLLSIAPRTAAKMIDTGKLEGHRLPGSQDRRVPIESFARFIDENGVKVYFDHILKVVENVL